MWVESMEKKLDDAEPMGMKEKWKKHCIFRVPPHFKVGRGNVFTPQTVALGPFHHNDVALRPMEEHKLRAVQHLLRRAGKPLRELAAAVEEMAEELEDAYAGLDGEWRGDNRGKFLEMMVADGCFLLEVMQSNEGYDQNDPVFGEHARRHIKPFVQRDMLMDEPINNIVSKFLCGGGFCATHVGPPLALHPLDLYRRSLLLRPTLPPAYRVGQRTNCCFPTTGATRPNEQGSSCCLPTRTETRPPAPRLRGESTPEPKPGTPSQRSAKRLWESGVRFKPSRTRCYDDIRFDTSSGWRLEMPRVHLDDSTEHKLSNLMAFEALRAGSGNAVTAFVLFMRDMVESEEDVAVLRKGKVLEHDLAGDDAAAVALFGRLTMDVATFGESDLCRVREEVEDYCDGHKCRVFVFKSWAKLRNSHLSSPWTFLALMFSLLLIGTDITQTVFAVMSYRHDTKNDGQELAPAAPKAARWPGHH
nr:unnamed protein product [Digitaria exilis]